LSHSLRNSAVVCLLALACAPTAAHAAAPASLKIAWKPSPNYTRADRPGSLVKKIVVHATEGGYFSSISWLQNAKAQASAHYVVSRRGAITQLVRDGDIAWHAGNWEINRTSIGIEHEGFVNQPGSFTDAEYRASARLAAYIARAHLMPIDRTHFIGHSDVPDPNHRGQFGGFAHHTDPGRYWDWKRYLGYVRSYAKGSKPPVFTAPKPEQQAVSVRTKPATTKKGAKAKGSTALGPVFAFQGLQGGKGGLTGFVPWQADVRPANVARVEFLVDGTLRWTAKKTPFRYGGVAGKLDTTQLPNGAHVLSIRVVSKKGAVVGSSVKVGIRNTPFAVAALAPANGTSVKGKVRLSAGVSGGLADHVEFVVDGRVLQTQRQPPFELDWDTAKVQNGAHTLTLRGTAQDGRVATTSVTVVVANPVSVAPTPTTPPRLTSIRLTGASLRDGQTVSRLVRWDAYVSGRDVERVDFFVDGALRWQDRGNPYRYDGNYGRWDTRDETNGQHVLTLRAVAVSGAEASATIVVTVANITQSRAALTAVTPPPSSTTTTTRPWTTTTWPTSTTTTTSSSSTTTTRRRPWWTTSTTSSSSSTTSTTTTTTTTSSSSTTTGSSSSTTTTTTTPTASLSVAVAGFASGETLGGSTQLVATTTGEVRRVEFWVDGSFRHSQSAEPYEYDLSTRRLRSGTHVLLVRAVGRGGTYADANLTFVVAGR
jgi:N-acetyl-anhydromuramyl-L-alanine amidase AmpD